MMTFVMRNIATIYIVTKYNGIKKEMKQIKNTPPTFTQTVTPMITTVTLQGDTRNAWVMKSTSDGEKNAWIPTETHFRLFSNGLVKC